VHVKGNVMAGLNERTAEHLLSILAGKQYHLSTPHQGITKIWLRADEFVADRQGYSDAPPIVISPREVEECVRHSLEASDQARQRSAGAKKELEEIAYRLKRAVKDE